MESSSEDELTARLSSQLGNSDSSSDRYFQNIVIENRKKKTFSYIAISTGNRSFYFKDDHKALNTDGSGSMEFAMFHLDISSSRPSTPDDIGCLTYNITKNDTEFQERLNQIKKEAFNNWLEGKL